MSTSLSLSNWYTYKHLLPQKQPDLIGLLRTSTSSADTLAAKALDIRARGASGISEAHAVLASPAVSKDIRAQAQAVYKNTFNALSAIYAPHAELGSEAQVASTARDLYDTLGRAIQDYNSAVEQVKGQAQTLLNKRQAFFDTYRAYGYDDQTIEGIAQYVPGTPLEPVDGEKTLSPVRSSLQAIVNRFQSLFDVSGQLVTENEDGSYALGAFTADFKRSAFGAKVITFYGGGASRPEAKGNYEALATSIASPAPDLEQAIYHPPADEPLAHRLARSENPAERLAAALFERCRSRQITLTAASAEIAASDLPTYRRNEARAVLSQLWRNRNNPAPNRLGGGADNASAEVAVETAQTCASTVSSAAGSYNTFLSSYRSTVSGVEAARASGIEVQAAKNLAAKIKAFKAQAAAQQAAEASNATSTSTSDAATTKAATTTEVTISEADMAAMTSAARAEATATVLPQFASYDTIFPKMRQQIAEAAAALSKAVLDFTDRFAFDSGPLMQVDAQGFAVMRAFTASWTPKGATAPALTITGGTQPPLPVDPETGMSIEPPPTPPNTLDINQGWVDAAEFARSLTSIPRPATTASAGLNTAA